MHTLSRPLCLLVLTLPLVAQQPTHSKTTYLQAHPIVQRPPHDPASSSLIVEEMPLVAPLFIEDRNASSVLVLANNSAEDAGAAISVRNLQGGETAHLHLVLKPHEDRHLPVATLLADSPAKARYGSISVLPDKDLKGPSIAGQLLITDNWNSTPAYLDEELAMPDMQGSPVLRSVTDDSLGQPLLAITNLSTQNQKATVHCLGSDSKQMETVLSIGPLATSLTAACSGTFISDLNHFLTQSAELKHRGVVGIEVKGDGVAGELAAFAIAPHLRNSETVFSSIPFTDPAMIHSPDIVFAGVPIGPQPALPNGVYVPRVSLSNFSTKPARVTVVLHATAQSRMESSDGNSSVLGPQTISSITIPPRQSREVVLKGTESQSGLLNSLYVNSDQQPGDVQGKVVSRSDGSLYEIELLGKDVRDLNNGGIHPWTTEGDAASHLVLYNHSSSTKKFGVDVFNGQILWDKTYYVDSGETLEISINQLMRDKVRDDKRQTLDPSLNRGVVNWNTPDSGNATGRLMVTSRSSVMARNYSCGNFTIPCTGYIQQWNDYLGVGQAEAIYGLVVGYCNSYAPGQCSGSSQGGGSANFSNTMGSPSIIAFNDSSQPSSQSPVLKGMAKGSSSFSASAEGNGCSEGGGGNAAVQMPGELFVQNDTEFTPSCPGRTALERQITYQIDDTTGTPMYSAIQLRENVPVVTSSCTSQVVHTGTTCTLNTLYQPGVVNEFTDSLVPGCLTSTATTPCGFQFPNQKWQACQSDGTQPSIGTIGPVSAKNNIIYVDNNSLSLKGMFFKP